ncbi:hypothetical protein LCGC14_2521170, partial [marine sediment metagenome]
MDSKFKGMAVSMGENASGASVKLENAIGDLQEVIGQKFAEAMKEARTELAAFVTEMVNAIATANALKAAEKATAEGTSTLADEILLAAEAVDEANDAMEDAKKITLEAEAFYGATSIQAGDLREAEQKLVNVLQDKKDHLEALEFIQEKEIEALKAAGKETDEVSQGSKDFVRILAELRVELEKVTEREQFLGDAYDENKAKSQAVLGAIEELIELGYKVENANIRDLLLLYGDLIEIRERAAGGGPEAPPIVSMSTGGGPFLAIFEAENEVLIEQIEIVENLERAYMSAGKNILGFMSTAFTGMAKAMGASEKEMFQIHKLFSAARTAINVIEATSKALTINPLLGIATGLLGAAAVGSILVQQPPSLGEGGIVRRPTMALIGERGPEAVVPLGAGGA